MGKELVPLPLAKVQPKLIQLLLAKLVLPARRIDMNLQFKPVREAGARYACWVYRDPQDDLIN